MSRLILARSDLLARTVVAFLLVAAMLGGVAPAHAARADKYAAIVIDANSGRVLYARNSDSYRYPASLTKMMTLYLTFEALSQNRLSLDDTITVSAHAAAQAPSKLGLKPGDTLTVREAILSLITKSANDSAVALAEKQAGSESDFAQEMTETAQKLGMDHTTFRNASGLPNRSQRTTAQDLATLGRALMNDFPQYFGLFSTPSFTWKGRKIPNHDWLLTEYAGTTGLKTGYTAASGFNLASSVERDGYRLIGVVLGGRTAKARDDHMMHLLDLQFARLKGSPMLASREPQVAQLPPVQPSPRPDDSDAPVVNASAADAAAPPDAKSSAPSAESVVAELDPAPDPIQQMAPVPNPSSSETPPTRTEPTRTNRRRRGQAKAYTPVGDPIAVAIAALTPASRPEQTETASLNKPTGEGDADGDASDGSDARVIDWLGNNQHWGIQIGAFTAMESAAARLSAAAALAPEALKSATPAIVSTENGRSTIYKARFGPFEEKEARNACNVLTSRGISCVPVKDTTSGMR
jgi:D-alanyl-D-alanine carboxypeptidase